MVLKSPAVLWCLLPARLSPSREKHQNDLRAHRRPEHEQEFVRPSRDLDLDLPDPLIPDGGIGESPVPPNRAVSPPVRPKRSSFTTFFAFSSKRKPAHEPPVVHLPQLKPDLLVPVQSVPGKWVPDRGRSQVHLIENSSVPSPLRADDDEYYYSYSPAFRSHPTSPIPDASNVSPSKSLSPRQQKPIGSTDINSQPSSAADSHPPRPFFQHPYAYSTHLDPKSSVTTIPPLRHATSQPFQLHPHTSRSDINTRPVHGRLPRHGHDSEPHLLHSHLRTSLSTPNLASGTPHPRSLTGRKHPTRSKERWLSAETWWDALFSPSPRLKAKQAPHSHTATDPNPHVSVRTPVQTEPRRALGLSFPSAPVLRPRAISIASVASNARSTPRLLSRSRSAADIQGQASLMATSRTGFEPALETLADERTPTPEQVPAPPPPDPPSLEQVIDEGEAFDQQRAEWKKQATRSIGNKHTRSVSRARSKSLSERQARGHHSAEGSKAQFSLEFLAARTLLGSQSTMPTVHVTRPSNSSSYSKANSHAYSHSAYSYTHTSNSHGYSHSHSHSLTTSHSSKSSRHLPPRGHSRAESWSKTALLKAGSLCGILQDESYSVPADEKVPSSSRVDVQSADLPGHTTGDMGASDTTRTYFPSWVMGNQVGIAITSSSTPEASTGMASLRHQERDKRSSKQKRQSFEYAGPHPSAIDSNLPQLSVTSDVSLRHRLPPRATIYPPIAPIAHPYRSASAPLASAVDRIGVASTSKVTTKQAATGRSTHISLSHADFEQYGVGEALVYASPPVPEKGSGSEHPAAESGSLPPAGLSPSQEQSPRETVPEPDSGIDNPPSLTSSTIQMVMSAFDNPDDLDEFQDLFYRPHPASRDQDQELSATINRVPTDVRSSAPNSPLTHLVRKLSVSVHGRQDPSRTPSDSIRRSKLQKRPSSESGTDTVSTNIGRSSSSLQESSSQLHVSIEDGSEVPTQPIVVVPEDIDSSYTASVLESPWAEHENDTFGYPIRHGQLEAATPPSPIQSPLRVSTHLSIQENQAEEDNSAFLRPGRTCSEPSSANLARSSYLTTSDMSQMSGLFDFPLPPTARPSGHVSILRASSEPTASSESRSHDEGEDEGGMEQLVGDEESADPSGDVGETLRVLRTTPRVTSYDSRRTTFGGSEDDMDYITELHQAHS